MMGCAGQECRLDYAVIRTGILGKWGFCGLLIVALVSDALGIIFLSVLRSTFTEAVPKYSNGDTVTSKCILRLP